MPINYNYSHLKKEILLKPKIIISSSTKDVSDSFLKLKEGDSILFYFDKVLLESHLIHELFNVNRRHLLGIFTGRKQYIKISFNNKNIYRIYFSGNSKSLYKNEIGLSYQSFAELGVDPKEKDLKFTLTQRFWYFFPFFWNNPKDEIRASYKLGIVALIVSIISLIISLK